MIFDSIVEWFKDLRTGMYLAKLRRQNLDRMSYDESIMQRMMERQLAWNNQTTRNSDLIRGPNPFTAHEVNDTIQRSSDEDVQDDGYEYSHGRTGYRIVNKIDSYGKIIGMWTRYELFYFSLKQSKDHIFYENFIYMSTDGLRLHDHQVEIDGVDLYDCNDSY